MNDTKTETARFVPRCPRRAWLDLVVALAVTSFASLAARATGGGGATHFSWDLIHVFGSFGNVVSAGGSDSAKAADGSQITLTGSGTWASEGDEQGQAVTGGGTWQTFGTNGASTGNGTYVVTGLVSFENAGPNGVAPPTLIDTIGSYLDARGGLLVLRVHYSDGQRGVLTISCHGPVNVPDTVFEGVTTTKGIVGYVDRGKPAAGVDGNRTVFHILPHTEDDDQQ